MGEREHARKFSAEEAWRNWQQLFSYFCHERDEDEITETTFETMTNCLLIFKPNVNIEWE